jgi:hypothetical protein
MHTCRPHPTNSTPVGRTAPSLTLKLLCLHTPHFPHTPVRARTLKALLDREQLFLTDVGKSACEAAARANMSHEWRLAFGGQLLQANGLGALGWVCVCGGGELWQLRLRGRAPSCRLAVCVALPVCRVLAGGFSRVASTCA